MGPDLMSIDDSIKQLTQQIQDNKKIRDNLAKKLAEAVLSNEFNLNITDAKTRSAQTELVLALNSVLDSSTKDVAIISKTLMSKKTTEEATNFAQKAVEILRNIRGIETSNNPVLNELDLKDADDIIDSIETQDISNDVISI